jgi:predicted transporter
MLGLLFTHILQPPGVEVPLCFQAVAVTNLISSPSVSLVTVKVFVYVFPLYVAVQVKV